MSYWGVLKSIVDRTGQASDVGGRCSQQLLVTSLLIVLSCPVQGNPVLSCPRHLPPSNPVLSCPRHLPPSNPVQGIVEGICLQAILSKAFASRSNPDLRTGDGIEGRGHCGACDDRVRPASRFVQGGDSEIHRERTGQRGGGNFHLYNNHSGNNNNHCSNDPYYSSSCSSG